MSKTNLIWLVFFYLCYTYYKLGDVMNEIDYKLKNILYKEIDVLDDNVLEKYFEHLDHLIDAIIIIRFKELKNNFFSIDEMDYFLKQGIDFVCEKKDEKYLELITKNILNKINTAVNYPVEIDFEEINHYIIDIYHTISYTDVFPKDIVNEMYNLILRKIKDAYFKLTKKEIKDELCEKLDYTEKKEKTIINSYKLKKVNEYLKKREYDKLNISKNKLQLMIKEKRENILNNRNIKNKIKISDEDFNYFEERFIQGSLNVEEIMKLLNCSKKIGLMILRKYNEVLLEISNNITLDKFQKNKLLYQRRHKVGFDYNNFVIVKNSSYLTFVEEIIKCLPVALKEKIVSNPKNYEEIAFLIPFLNYFPELDIDKYCKILKNYPVVKESILKEKECRQKYISDQEWLLGHILDIITLSLGYSNVNEAQYALLGKEVYEKNPLRSAKYAEFYLKMLNKKSSYLPIIKSNYQGYTYELGNYSDSKRLLIGTYCEGSCIDLFNNKGRETYEKVLLDKDADVIMINNPNKEFYSRIIVFRKGNFVLMAPIKNKSLSHDCNLFDKNLVKHIALSIIKESMKNDDNIDFVLMANTTFYNDKGESINDFATLDDIRFTTLFPHADLDEKVLVLASKPDAKYVSFDVSPKEEYYEVRKKINYHPTNEDVLRVLALNNLLNNDEESLKPFDVCDYLEVIVGDCFVLALRKDYTIFECLLSNASKISVNEFVNAKMKLMEKAEINKFPMI